MLESAIYIGSIILSEIFLRYECNLILKMITYDSLFGTINTLKNFINHNLTESQIIQKSYSLYNNSLLDRMIFYGICQTIYCLIKNFLWADKLYILYYGFLITIIPTLINKIINNKVFKYIRKKKEFCIKLLIAKLLSVLMTVYSKIYLERDVHINDNEFMNILKDYKETLDYFLEVVKNCVAILGLAYVKKYSVRMYYTIIKYIYNYKTGEFLETYNKDSAKKYLINIIDNKRWIDLKKPNTYKAMIYLYQNNYDDTDIFNKIIKEINFLMIKMFTVWSLASIFSNIYIIPIISLAMAILRKFYNKINWIKLLYEGIVILITVPVSYYYPSYFLSSFVCQYGSLIIFNKGSYFLIESLSKKSIELSTYIFENNHDLTLSYIVTACCLGILGLMKINNMYLIMGLNLIMNISTNSEFRKQLSLGLLIVSTYLSNYNILHIIHNCLVLYLVTGIIDNITFLQLKDTIQNWIEKNVNLQNIIRIFNEIHLNYRQAKDMMISFIMQIIYYFIRKKNNQERRIQLVFDLMDTEKFPSMTLSKEDKLMDDSVSLDDEIFNQPDDIFLKEISVDDNNDSYNIIKTIKDKNNLSIIDNFFN